MRRRVDHDAEQERRHVKWIGSGVVDIPDPQAAPRDGGYGRMLIKLALSYQLRAAATYTLGQDGERCEFNLPPI